MRVLAFLFVVNAAVLPNFDAYFTRVEEIARPKLSLRSHPIGRKYPTVLREAVSHGVAAAGHFAVAHWGCGTNCSQFALVDLQTGEIDHDPKRILARGLEYRPDSQLIVLNPWNADLRDFPNIPTQYCVVDEGRLRVIKTIRHDD
jgi:hypothetical protein